MKARPNILSTQAGFSMIEVLVALIILLIGLLGLAGVMVQSQRSEMESYQRVQAEILLRDMVARIEANRMAASCYVPPTLTGVPYFGTGSAWAAPATPWTSCITNVAALYGQAYFDAHPDVYSTLTQATAQATADATNQALTAISDMTAWNTLLLGSAETSGGANTGAMINARGCISYDATSELNAINGTVIPGTGVYTVSVAWQGLGGTAAPTSNCGVNLYLDKNGNIDDKLRRVVSLTLRIASINNLQ